jgi:hypothetical protein
MDEITQFLQEEGFYDLKGPDKTFLCPYCNNGSIKLADHMFCGDCFAEVRSQPILKVEHAVQLSSGNDLYA